MNKKEREKMWSNHDNKINQDTKGNNETVMYKKAQNIDGFK